VQIRYITGRGGRIDRGLSAYLATLTRDYKGLAADSNLLSLSVDEQVECVREFTASGESLIVNSYGGYLLMLSLIDAHKAPRRLAEPLALATRSVRDQAGREEGRRGTRSPRQPNNPINSDNTPSADAGSTLTGVAAGVAAAGTATVTGSSITPSASF